MYLPLVDTFVNPLALFLIGLSVGVLSGFFGSINSLLIVPALNIFGFPMAYAVGTNLASVLGKSVITTFKEALYEKLELKLAVLLGIFGMVGITLGKGVILSLEGTGNLGSTIRAVYFLLLFIAGAFVFWQYLRSNEPGEMEQEVSTGDKKRSHFRFFRLPPLVSFRHLEGGPVSLWAIALLGIGAGFVSAFLGIGGGFWVLPVLAGIAGLKRSVACGTVLLGVLIYSAWGVYSYAAAGRVEAVAAIIILLGSGIGMQLGSLATAIGKQVRLKLYFSFVLMLGSVSVVLKQLSLATLAGYLLVLAILSLAVSITVGFLAARVKQKTKVGKGIVVEKRMLV